MEYKPLASQSTQQTNQNYNLPKAFPTSLPSRTFSIVTYLSFYKSKAKHLFGARHCEFLHKICFGVEKMVQQLKASTSCRRPETYSQYPHCLRIACNSRSSVIWRPLLASQAPACMGTNPTTNMKF